jgi:hypothetical protein
MIEQMHIQKNPQKIQKDKHKKIQKDKHKKQKINIKIF